MQRSKLYKKNLGQLDRETRYTFETAVAKMKNLKHVKFDESVDIAINLGVDPRHADQIVRGTVSLPNGTGKTVRVLVFARGDNVDKALAAGANYAGGEEYAEKIQKGWTDIDVVIATPDMMSVVGRLGRVLGPRGLMPNPKSGTVTPDVEAAVKETLAGKIEFRVDKKGIIHAIVGKVSFDNSALVENINTLIAALKRAQPAATKGAYIKRVTLSSTMGPGLKIDTATI